MADRPEFNGIGFTEMYEFLEEKYRKFNNEEFIVSDPISVPHSFDDKKDIEISGFLTATIAWGRRDLIIRSAKNLMDLMGNNPYQFLMDAGKSEIDRFNSFYYRTFNGQDCRYFIKSLRNIYLSNDSMEDILFRSLSAGNDMKGSLVELRNHFFLLPHETRTEKHFANVSRGAAGKRLNMFLRWMVRSDNSGVDFGLWKRVPMSELYIPLDLHSGKVARKLGLLKRKASDWKAVEELTSNLSLFDPADPVKYDYALFGMGVNEKL